MEIKKLELERHDLNNELEKLMVQKKNYIYDMIIIIDREYHRNKTPELSNADKRERAAIKSLSKDEQYNATITAIRGLRDGIARKTIDIDEAKRTFIREYGCIG